MVKISLILIYETYFRNKLFRQMEGCEKRVVKREVNAANWSNFDHEKYCFCIFYVNVENYLLSDWEWSKYNMFTLFVLLLQLADASWVEITNNPVVFQSELHISYKIDNFDPAR